MTALSKTIQEKLYSFFPSSTPEYKILQAANTLFSRIEAVAFASFLSLRKIELAEIQDPEKRQLLLQRTKTIDSILSSRVDGKKIQDHLNENATLIETLSRKALRPKEKHLLSQLERQHTALLYRSGAIDKKFDEEAGNELAKKIEPIIEIYISNPKIFPGRQGKSGLLSKAVLTAEEKAIIHKGCTRYPLFFEKMLERHTVNGNLSQKTDAWTASFVKWCLRSKCSLGVFIKSPNEADALAAVHLDKRSGAIDKSKGIKYITLSSLGFFKKVVGIKIDDNYQPIQGNFKNRVVTLKNLVDSSAAGLTIKIKDIFASFKKKTGGYENVEYMQGGIRNWNSIQIGSYNQKTKKIDKLISFNPNTSMLAKLIDKAPLTSYTKEDITKRYDIKTSNAQLSDELLADGQLALALRSTRTKTNLNILEAHGFMEVVQRRGDHYFVLPIGVQPVELPQSSIAKLLYLTATNKAGAHYPDESFFLSQRQQMGIFFPLGDEEALRLETHVNHLFKEGSNGSLLFQFAGTNCSYHVQKMFDHVIGDPLHSKIKEVADRAFNENIIFGAFDKISFSKAFEGLNHDSLKSVLDKLTKYLWDKKDAQTAKDLALICHGIACRFNKVQHKFDPNLVDIQNSEHRKHLKKILFETVELVRFYRLDLFKAESDQNILAAMTKIVQAMPWRWLQRVVSNTILFLFGSWRWAIVKKETPLPIKKAAEGEKPKKSLHFASTATNPLLQEGYLNHPAALWNWKMNKKSHLHRIFSYFRLFQAS